MIGSSQTPLPDNTQHSQETGIHTPAGFELAIPANAVKKIFEGNYNEEAEDSPHSGG
jgi:hypothetical protein